MRRDVWFVCDDDSLFTLLFLFHSSFSSFDFFVSCRFLNFFINMKFVYDIISLIFFDCAIGLCASSELRVRYNS